MAGVFEQALSKLSISAERFAGIIGVLLGVLLYATFPVFFLGARFGSGT